MATGVVRQWDESYVDLKNFTASRAIWGYKLSTRTRDSAEATPMANLNLRRRGLVRQHGGKGASLRQTRDLERTLRAWYLGGDIDGFSCQQWRWQSRQSNGISW
jgi:hypothetical protein